MMARAATRHILVESEEACEKIKAKIAAGADFADMAQPGTIGFCGWFAEKRLCRRHVI